MTTTTPSPTTPTVSTGPSGRAGPTGHRRTSVAHGLRVLRVEVRDELLAIVREPSALFFSVAMPVAFFALFASWLGDEMDGSVPVATSMLATFGTFGVVGVTLLNPGIGVADDRERGWLRAKRVSATPLPVTLAAKVIATVPYALGVLAAMTAVAAATGNLQIEVAEWARLVPVLIVGAVPFALLGLTVGFLASPNATTAILNAFYIPSAVAGGLWMPLETLPELVQRLAPFTPTYHLAQLGLAQLEGGGLPGRHVLALLLTAVVGSFAAAMAYRRARS
jgi:ABC-2 type transport system permease protein